MNVIIKIVKYFIFMIGGLLILWGLFCFLGGPEGDPGRGMPFAIIFLILGSVVILVGRWFGKISKENNLSDATTSDVAPVKTSRCPVCKYVFHGEYGKEGWWCPNCNDVRNSK